LGRTLFRGQVPGLDERGTDLGWMEWHSDPNRKAQPAAALVPGTPAGLSELLERMIEKDPAKRCQTLEEALGVIQDLANRTRQTQQIKPQGKSSNQQARRSWHLGIVTAAVTLTLVALILLAVRLLR
jgi:serine/threonine protein kinase